MIENKVVRSKSSASQVRHSYTLADGQRIPVLFRMRNVQSGATSSRSATASNQNAKEQLNEELRIDTPSESRVATAAIVPGPKFIGPSWLRRNAYRMTVAVLLLMSLAILNNNRKQNETTSHSPEPSINVAAAEAAVKAEAPHSIPKEPVKADTQIAVTPETVVAPPVSLDPPATAVVSTPTSVAPAVAQPTVSVTETDNSTKYVISNPPSSDNAAPIQAELTAGPTNSVAAAATLLAPQTLSESPAVAPNAFPTSLQKRPSSEQAAASAFTEVTATPVSTSNANPQGADQVAGTVFTNRYATQPGSNWQSSGGALPSTGEPNLDPSMLFAIKQNYKGQSSEQTVRDMRQQLQNSAPTAPTNNSTWQAIPASGPNQFGATNSNSVPTEAILSNAGSNVAIPNTSSYQQYGQTIPTAQQIGQAYPPAQQFGPNTTGAPPPNQFLPQQGAVASAPLKSPYVPIGTPAGAAQESSLYPTATNPDGSPMITPQRPSAYKPMYPNFGTQETNTTTPSATNGQLYESADQNFGMDNYPVRR